MATLETLRGKILTSIHGRRFGLGPNGELIGPKCVALGVTEATSDTTGTALPNSGMVSVVTTTNDTWTLTDPYAGAEVTLMTGSSSTGTHTVTCAAAVIYSTNGIAGASVLLAGAGAAMTLYGYSTSQWRTIGSHGSTVSVSVSS